VTIGGDWHLWIESASWRLEVGAESVKSSAFEIAQLDVALDLLSGQALTSVEFDRSKREAHWSFDIDGHFLLGPKTQSRATAGACIASMAQS
jgi:hypothetical protein